MLTPIQFIIISKTNSFEAFMTPYYSYENNYNEDMIVIDLWNNMYANDGKNWLEMLEDHL